MVNDPAAISANAAIAAVFHAGCHRAVEIVARSCSEISEVSEVSEISEVVNTFSCRNTLADPFRGAA
ncbi:hypothetical protein GCM10023318_48510 [Nocardia callitridis]|uniref:Uncharacterized protein n=1 Tax=Nocardia callitridis TaxID=648753 RepID=A0ABP9KQ36_9NOCA